MEIKDFTVRLENLPDFEYYNGDEIILKMKLWVQILDILKSKLKMNAIYDRRVNINDPRYQIADINFGKESIKELELLSEMM